MSHPYHQPDHQPLLDYQVSKTSERVDILNYPREGQSQIAIPTTSASDVRADCKPCMSITKADTS